MTHSTIRRLIAVTLASALLTGCEDGAAPFGAKASGTVDATAGAKPQKPRKGDVETPDVYSTTGEALWDGRPSLGGIWVAAPDAVNPERVMIRNAKTGKSVTGALFRRERENPGPPLQISSDAAEALGMLAGQPGTISVVALGRAEPEPVLADEAVAATETEAEADKAVSPVAASATPASTDVGAVAGAAIDAAEGVTLPTDAAVAPEGAPDTPAAEVAATPPARKGFLGGLFKPRKPRADAGAPLSAITDTAPPAPVGAPAVAATIETAPIDPAPAAAPGGTFRYAIGAFSVEANATTAADTLGKAGLTASVQPGTTAGKPIWAVYATGTGNKADLLAKIKSLGFKDAYSVK